MKTRICAKCKKRKRLNEYHKSKRHSLGRKLECADCTNKYLRDHYNKNYKGKPETKRKQTEYHYKRKYGIEYKDYLKMYEKQKGRCLICLFIFPKVGTFSKGKKDVLVVDHCHNSGKIRGLICNKCNQGLGLFNDCPETIINAAFYLIDRDNL